MKKKALALAVAGALVSPAAFAAQDTSGMQYTSAAEGFYASIRAVYLSNAGVKDTDSSIGNSGSRIGIRGTNDLGGGMSGFYNLEWGTSIDNGNEAPFSVRHGHVGLRGAFGSVRLGSGWSHLYNNTYSITDVGNEFSTTAIGGDMPSRTEGAIQYDSPDLNGFQMGAHMSIQGGQTGADANDVDDWGISGTYSVAGFTVGAGYHVKTDGIIEPAITTDTDGDTGGIQGAAAIKEDSTFYALSGRYAQDNWYVATWYAIDNASDGQHPLLDDTERFSLAGGVTVDKVQVYAIYSNVETNGVTAVGNDTLFNNDTALSQDDAATSFGVQYNMGSNTRVWIDYINRDFDTDATAEDGVAIGLRHDF